MRYAGKRAVRKSPIPRRVHAFSFFVEWRWVQGLKRSGNARTSLVVVKVPSPESLLNGGVQSFRYFFSSPDGRLAWHFPLIHRERIVPTRGCIAESPSLLTVVDSRRSKTFLSYWRDSRSRPRLHRPIVHSQRKPLVTHKSRRKSIHSLAYERRTPARERQPKPRTRNWKAPS